MLRAEEKQVFRWKKNRQIATHAARHLASAAWGANDDDHTVVVGRVSSVHFAATCNETKCQVPPSSATGTDASVLRSPFHRLSADACVGACCAQRAFSTTARDGGKPLDRALSTRIGRQSAVDQPRIALLAEIRNEPGALHTLLKPFQDFRINLNRIESRPSKKGEHWFEMALDFNGDATHPNVQNFIEELKKHTANMLVLDQREVPW